MPRMLWKIRGEHLKLTLKKCTNLCLYKHDFHALIIEFNRGTYKKEMYSSKFFLRQDLPKAVCSKNKSM